MLAGLIGIGLSAPATADGNYETPNGRTDFSKGTGFEQMQKHMDEADREADAKVQKEYDERRQQKQDVFQRETTAQAAKDREISDIEHFELGIDNAKTPEEKAAIHEKAEQIYAMRHGEEYVPDDKSVGTAAAKNPKSGPDQRDTRAAANMAAQNAHSEQQARLREKAVYQFRGDRLKAQDWIDQKTADHVANGLAADLTEEDVDGIGMETMGEGNGMPNGFAGGIKGGGGGPPAGVGGYDKNKGGSGGTPFSDDPGNGHEGIPGGKTEVKGGTPTGGDEPGVGLGGVDDKVSPGDFGTKTDSEGGTGTATGNSNSNQTQTSSQETGNPASAGEGHGTGNAGSAADHAGDTTTSTGSSTTGGAKSGGGTTGAGKSGGTPKEPTPTFKDNSCYDCMNGSAPNSTPNPEDDRNPHGPGGPRSRSAGITQTNPNPESDSPSGPRSRTAVITQTNPNPEGDASPVGPRSRGVRNRFNPSPEGDSKPVGPPEPQKQLMPAASATNAAPAAQKSTLAAPANMRTMPGAAPATKSTAQTAPEARH